MAIEQHSFGTVFTGPDVHVYRIFTLATGMRLELAGLRIKRFSITARVKREFGLTGTRQSVYEQFCRMHSLEPYTHRRIDENQTAETPTANPAPESK